MHGTQHFKKPSAKTLAVVHADGIDVQTAPCQKIVTSLKDEIARRDVDKGLFPTASLGRVAESPALAEIGQDVRLRRRLLPLTIATIFEFPSKSVRTARSVSQIPERDFRRASVDNKRQGCAKPNTGLEISSESVHPVLDCFV